MELTIKHLRRDKKYVFEILESERVICTYTQEHLGSSEANVTILDKTYTFSEIGPRHTLITGTDGSYELTTKGFLHERTTFTYEQKTYVRKIYEGILK